jgi:hypothetical protein
MLVWGTKRKLKRIGIVADFCPICRAIQPIEVSSVSMVNHLYFLPLGSGKIVGFIGACKDCGIEWPVPAQKYPKTFDQEPNNFQELINNTYPNILDVYHKRLEIEERISKRKALTQEERENLLSEPFNVISPMLERQYGESTKFDKKSGRSCAFTLLVPLVFFCISIFFFNQVIVDILKLAAALFTIAGIIITLVFIFTTHPRYLQQIIYPALVKALYPLNPTIEELDGILARYKSLGLQIGKRIKAEKILEEMAKLHQATR